MSSGMAMRIRTALRWRLNALRTEWRRVVEGQDRCREYADWNYNCRWRRLCFAHDPQIGWRFLPNLRARLYHDGGFYVLRTNAAGWRSDHEYAPPAGHDRRRLAVLGDSYTAGDGVDNAARFTERLAESRPDWEVLNFGLPNTGPDQHLLILEHHVLAWQPDAVLWALSAENIFRLRQKWRPALEWESGRVCYRAKPYFKLEQGELRLKNVPVPAAIMRPEELDAARAEFEDRPEPGADPYAVYDREDTPEWRLLTAIVARFTALASPRPVFLAVLPTVEFIVGAKPARYQERFRALHDPARQRWVLDLLPAFRERPREERRACLFPHDPHFSALGHSVVAAALAQALPRGDQP